MTNANVTRALQRAETAAADLHAALLEVQGVVRSDPEDPCAWQLGSEIGPQLARAADCGVWLRSHLRPRRDPERST